jgi:protein-arginine kinase activator protein McsA
MKCEVCEENEATMKIHVTSIKDGEVWDTTNVCHDCAVDPAAEICLILPERK